MNANKRIAYIDIMKGIAILSVVAGHYSGMAPLNIIIWSFHMPLFIFLNGFFFKDGDIWPRIKKSAKSYEYPYIIVWLILLIIESVLAFLGGGEVWGVAKTRLLSGFWALASNSTSFIPSGVVKIGAIWFLNALFWGTVILSLVLKIKSWICQFVLVAILLMGGVFLTSKMCVPLGLNYAVAFLMWLWVGYWYSRQKHAEFSITERLESRLFPLLFLIWMAIVLIEGCTHNQYNICWLRFPLYGLELLGAFCGIMVVMYISKQIERHTHFISNVLQYLGCSSLWVLCVHALDIELFPYFTDWVSLPRYIIVLIRGSFDLLVALCLREGVMRIRSRQGEINKC